MKPRNANLEKGHGTAISAASWLAELRRKAGLSEAELAERLGVSQSWVAQVESETDVRVSTVSAYVAALGGELHFHALLPNGEDINLDQYPQSMSERDSEADPAEERTARIR
jgi:transcriptional regulator with XRE-family HTH domain